VGGLLGSFRSILICGLLLALLNLIFYCTMGWLPTYLASRDGLRFGSDRHLVISFVEVPAILLLLHCQTAQGKEGLIIILSFLLWPSVRQSYLSAHRQVGLSSRGLGSPWEGSSPSCLPALELVETKKWAETAGGIISMDTGALSWVSPGGYLRDLTGGFGFGFMVMAVCGMCCRRPCVRTARGVKKALTSQRESYMNDRSSCQSRPGERESLERGCRRLSSSGGNPGRQERQNNLNRIVQGGCGRCELRKSVRLMVNGFFAY